MENKYFGKFDPLKNEMVMVIDEDGNVKNPKLMPKLSEKVILEAYRLMCLSRQQDRWDTKYQRQGRILSFLTSTGQEACEVAYAMQIQKGIDWFSGAYRNNAAWLSAGVPMHQIMLYWAGNEAGSKMPEDINVLPINIPIATQFSFAAGIGFANKYLNRKGVVISTIGDGGTSEGEFYESLNFAKLHEVPVIFCIENNQYAISTPVKKATKAQHLASKGIAVGIPNVLVDGNDFFACYAVVKEAMALARAGKGPHIIEFYTYRLGPHSSSDDPTVYRSKEELEAHEKVDPIKRMKKYLVKQKMWDDQKEEALEEEQKQYVKDEFKTMESKKEVHLEDIFKYTYSEMTENLKEELEEAKSIFGGQGHDQT